MPSNKLLIGENPCTRLKKERLISRYLPLLLCTFCIACAPLIETLDGRHLRATSDEFRDYAATIFRQQNAASVAVVEALDDISLQSGTHSELATHSTQLQLADEQMFAACAPLNSLAAARRDGSEISRSEQFALINAVLDCHGATIHAETIISNLYEQFGR